MRYRIEDFLNIRNAFAGSFSRDASALLIHSNLSGVTQVYRAPVSGGPLVRLTDFDEPCSGTYMPASRSNRPYGRRVSTSSASRRS